MALGGKNPIGNYYCCMYTGVLDVDGYLRRNNDRMFKELRTNTWIKNQDKTLGVLMRSLHGRQLFHAQTICDDRKQNSKRKMKEARHMHPKPMDVCKPSHVHKLKRPLHLTSVEVW